MLIVKKYANRRLYDTARSRYITLEDLAELIRRGADVAVQDAHTGEDLTQQILTQIILESRGGARLLPVKLLVRLIRMEDEALADFFTRYVSWALESYTAARERAKAFLPLNPLATVPFAATDALARMVAGRTPWTYGGDAPAAPPGRKTPIPPPWDVERDGPVPIPREPPSEEDLGAPPAPAAPPAAPAMDDVSAQMARLREEIDALKRSVSAGPAVTRRSKKRPAKKR